MPQHFALTAASDLHYTKAAATALAGQTLRYGGDGTESAVNDQIGNGSIVVTTADYTLSQAEGSVAYLKVTGALTGNRAVIVPNTWGPVVVSNETTGAYTLTFKTVSGTGIAVTQAKRCLLVADAVNVVRGAAEI